MNRGLIAGAVFLILATVVVLVAASNRPRSNETKLPEDQKTATAAKTAGEEPRNGESAVESAVRIVIECEAPERMEDRTTDGQITLRKVAAQSADMYGGAGYLECPDGWIDRCGLSAEKGRPGDLPGKAFYKVEIPRDDVYFVFIHAKWLDSCGNSVWLRFDDGEYKLVTDSEGKTADGWKWAWHVVREKDGPKPYKLTKGAKTLELAVHEDGPCFDQIFISTDPTKPVGHAIRPEAQALPPLPASLSE